MREFIAHISTVALRTIICFLIAIMAALFPLFAAAQDNQEVQSGLATEKVLVDSVVSAASSQNGVDSDTGLPAALLDANVDPVELDYRMVPLTKDELAALAERWLAIVKAKTEEVAAAQVAVYQTTENIEEAARAKVTELSDERRDLFKKYASVISAWEKKGGDADAIASYRAYQSAIVVEEARSADFKTLLAQAKNWLFDRDGGIDVLINISILVLSLLILFFVAGVVRRLAGRWIERVPNLSKLLQAFLLQVVYWLVFSIGLMVVLSALGVDITPVFALIGGASFVLAFAFQDTLGNLASGIMIMINRPFDQGDYVDIGGVGGTVKTVSVVATTVLTPDNQVIVIPNKNVWGNTITNVTASDTRRVDLVFGIAYEDSIPEAADALEEVVKAHPMVLKEPAPVIRVHELADSSVNFVCRPWTKTSDYWTVYWDLTQQVKERFDQAGISIPFPQQDIHVYPRKNIDVRHITDTITENEKPPLSHSHGGGDETASESKQDAKAKATAQGEA
jgi:small conductance mechanosensitive channel